MPLQRLITKATLVVAVLMVVAASKGSAQQQRALFQWTGPVDRQVEIVMHGRDISTRMVGDNERRGDRSRVESVLPQEEGYVGVDVRRGRGQTEVIQQPSVRNDFTTIIRIRDDNPGSDQYVLIAYWSPRGRLGNVGNGGWNGNGGHNDDWNRGDRDRADRDHDDRDRDGHDHNGRDRDGRDRDGRGSNGNDRGNGRGWGWGNGYGVRHVAHWSGRIDDVVEIRIQGRRLDTIVLSGNSARGNRAEVQGLPRRDANIRIRENEGRGRIRVVQQPSRRNGYTAVIRIRDPQSGYGYYDFDVLWQ